MSEAQEIALGKESGRPDPPGDGRLRRPRAAALRQRHRPAAGQAVGAAQPAVAVRGGRSAGRQRVRAARRLHLPDPRHPAVPRRRRRSWPACSATKSATSRRATRRSSTRAPIGGQLGLVALGVFVPAARPFGQASQQAMGLLFLKYGRDDELQADQLGVRYAAAAGWDPGGRARHAVHARPPRRSVGRPQGRAELPVHAPRAARARRARFAPTVAKLKAGGGSASSPIARRCASRVDGPDLRRQPGAGHRARHHVPASAAALPPRLSRQWADGQQPAAGRGEGAEAATSSCCCSSCSSRRAARCRTWRVASMQQAGFRHVRGERTTIGGLEAYVGEYQGMIEGLGEVPSRAAHLRYGDNVYMIAGLAPRPGRSTSTTAPFDSTPPQLPLAVGDRGRGDQAEPHRAVHGARRRYVASLAGRSGGAITRRHAGRHEPRRRRGRRRGSAPAQGRGGG